MFGGGEVDLRDATLDPAGATLHVSTLFGGGSLVVPEGWNVETSLSGIGGVGDMRPKVERSPDAPTLRVEGTNWFGGWGSPPRRTRTRPCRSRSPSETSRHPPAAGHARNYRTTPPPGLIRAGQRADTDGRRSSTVRPPTGGQPVAMIRTSPFHARTSALNETGLWSHWSGHLAAERYGLSDKFEYFAVRNAAGIFDTSPLFKYRFSGPGAERFLAGVLARDPRTLEPGHGQYAIWCDDRGSAAVRTNSSFACREGRYPS